MLVYIYSKSLTKTIKVSIHKRNGSYKYNRFSGSRDKKKEFEVKCDIHSTRFVIKSERGSAILYFWRFLLLKPVGSMKTGGGGG